jgi:hypothetical protein
MIMSTLSVITLTMAATSTVVDGGSQKQQQQPDRGRAELMKSNLRLNKGVQSSKQLLSVVRHSSSN